MESLFFFGDALKALDDNGKIGGYLVRFCDDGSKKDLAGEYFTSKTYLGSREGDGVDVMFHHGQPLPFKAGLKASIKKELVGLQDQPLGTVKTTRDAIGIWAETVLNMADEYEAAVFGIVKAGKLGWSSGAVGHLVKKSSDGQITRWPIGEASITPQPCEPLNRALTLKGIESVKFIALDDDDPAPIAHDKQGKRMGLAAKLNQLIEDLADDKGRDRASIINALAREAGIEAKSVEAILSGQDRPADPKLKAFARVLDVSFDVLKSHRKGGELRSIKGMFADLMAEQTPSRWELESTYCRGVRFLANAAVAAQLADVEFDLEAKMEELTTEYTAILQSHALSQIRSWIEEGGGDEFYLKSAIDIVESVNSLASADLDTHLQLAESVTGGLFARFRTQHEARKKESTSGNHDGQKAGRVLSKRNRERLMEWGKQLQTLGVDIQGLLKDSQPKASDAEQRAAMTKHLMSKHRRRASTIGA